MNHSSKKSHASRLARFLGITTVLATLWVVSIGSASAAAVLVSPNGTLNSAGWALDAPNMAQYTAALTNPAFFGPAGTVSTAINVNLVGAVNAATLAGADIFVSPWWQDGQTSAAAITAVTNFFLGGGNLFLLQDDPGHDAIGAALGIPSFNSSSNPHTVSDPNLGNGPFGVVNLVNQHFTQGFLQALDITGNGGTVAATDSIGRATIGIWDYDDYAPGAGRMVIMADVDFISNIGNANYNPGFLNANSILGLNATNYLLPVPEGISTLLMLSFGTFLIAGLGRIRRS